MKLDTYKCDVCDRQKKDANHWWKAYRVIRDDTQKFQGLLIAPWDARPFASNGHPAAPAYVPGISFEPPEAHLCGADCVTQWLSKNLL